MRYVVFIARLVIGSLFVYASIYKIIDPADFSNAIRNYLILPVEWSNIAALTLPWIEFVAGTFLILGVQTKPAALLTTGMLAVFLAALVYAYSTGLDIDCGCFGSAADSEGRVGIFHILRDTGFFVLSLAIVLFDGGHFCVERALPLLWKRRASSPA